jgi:membrane peptidoglycan carboxypeptidase
VRTAVAQSINIPAIKVAEDVGIKEVIKYAYMMGVKTEIEPYLPAAIGGIKGLRPIEMAAAYAVFASGGIYAEPMAVLKITDSEGGVIEQNHPVARRVLNRRTAEKMDELFRGVVTSGTGKMVASVPESRGKTGTTNKDIDVWFIGYIPNKISTAVWAGNDDNTPMNRVFGGLVCAPIWREFTAEALKIYREEHAKLEKNDSRRPRQVAAEEEGEQHESERRERSTETEDANEVVTVNVCVESQLLATRWCPSTSQETFTAGAAPNQPCNIHGPPEAPAVTQPPARERLPERAPERPTERVEERRQPSVEPVRLTVCSDTGKIATRQCPRTVTRTFTIGNAPTEVCDAHQRP